MADELTINATLQYDDGTTELFGQVVGLLPDVAVKTVVKLKMSVAITETPIPIPGLTAPGWAIFINRDATHFIELLTGTGGDAFGKMLPGEPAMIRLGADAQVPYAIADTAPCIMEYVIVST